DWFFNRFGDDTRQCIHALHRGTRVQRAKEVTIKAGNPPEAAEAVGQKHLHAHGTDLSQAASRRTSGSCATRSPRNRWCTLPAQPRSPRARLLSRLAIHWRTGVVNPVFDRE